MDVKEKEELIRKYAQNTGKSVKELKKILEEVEKEAEEAGLVTDNAIKGMFGKKVRNLVWAEKQGTKIAKKEAVTFRGFIIGADAIRDIKEQMRRKALRVLSEEGDSARIAGYVDENGTPLDWRPTVRNRRGEEVENPDYHKPITGHLYVRDFYGIAMKEGSTEPKLFVMTLWRGFANTNWKPFVPIEFKTTIKEENNQYMVLSMPRFRKGEKLFKVTDEKIPVHEWIEKALKTRRYNLAELEKAFQDTKNAKDPWILTEGIVDYIDSTVNPKTGSRSVFLTDPDSGMLDRVRIFISKDFPLTFKEWSRVLVFGTARSYQREEDSDVTYFINGISLYPIPGQTVEVGSGSQAAEPVDEVSDEEGWDLWEE